MARGQAPIPLGELPGSAASPLAVATGYVAVADPGDHPVPGTVVEANREHSLVYRAYRVPYEWIPQVEKPDEIAIPRLDNSKFRVTDIADKRVVATTLRRAGRVNPDPTLCILPPIPPIRK